MYEVDRRYKAQAKCGYVSAVVKRAVFISAGEASRPLPLCTAFVAQYVRTESSDPTLFQRQGPRESRVYSPRSVLSSRNMYKYTHAPARGLV